MSDANSNDSRRPTTPEVATDSIGRVAESGDSSDRRAGVAAASDTAVSPDEAAGSQSPDSRVQIQEVADLVLSSDEMALHTPDRQSEQTKWQLPERFRLDKSNPEQKKLLDQVEQQQKLWAQNVSSPFSQSSPEDQERARSVRIVEEIRTVLADVEKRIAKKFRVQDLEEFALLDRDRLALRHQLAERYAIIGRYDLAAEIEPQRAYRNEYLKILEAVLRDDADQCECPPHRGQGTQNFSVSQQFVVQDVWSIKHGCVMPLVKCNGCGHLNVKPMPAHLSEQRSHRARAQQLAGRLTPEETARTLTQHGHTAARLLK